jgi:hypothetical protein
MIKYQKELEYVINYYFNEEKKRNIFKEKAVNSIVRNVNFVKKVQEVDKPLT